MVSDLGGTVLAMVAIVTLWSIAILIMIGIGIVIGRLLGLGASTRFATFFWLGLAATVGWLFLIHLVLPLDSLWARLPLVGAGVAGWWLPYRRRRDEGLESLLPDRASGWLVLAGGLIPVLVIANLALAEPSNYDSYFYHFASIRHYSEYGAIEGLVNLHHRLAFQASTLPLASFLDLPPFEGEGFRLVNGFLATGLVFELSSRLGRGVRAGRFGLGDVLLAVATPFLLFIPGSASPTSAIASPSLDTGAAILCLVAFAYFVDAATKRSAERIAVAFVILCLAATFRQLNLVVLFFATLVLGWVLWKQGVLGTRTVRMPVIIGGAVLLSSALHSTVVSGYPFYPATFPSLGLPWAHPLVEAAAVRDFVAQFARGTLGDPISLTGPPDRTISWIGDWVAELRQTGQLRRLQLLGLISLISLAGVVISRNRRAGARRLVLLLVPLVPTLAFWFASAPLLRFGFGPIALTLALPVALLVTSGRDELGIKGLGRLGPQMVAGAVSIGVLLVVATLFMAAGKYGSQGSMLISANGSGDLGSRAPKPIEVQEIELDGGVEVFQPTENTYCGFELWCTIETQFGLKLRGDSFSDGFERLSEESPSAARKSE